MNNGQNIGKLQHFEWGSLLWFYEPSDFDTERLSVGLVTFNPFAVHEEHLHAGDEQVIYVISGQGRHWVNDEPEDIQTGDIRHIPPYARHRMENLLAGQLKLIIVYTPSKFEQLLSKAPQEGSIAETSHLHLLDTNSLGALLNKLAVAIDMGLAVLDTNGVPLITTSNHSTFCSLIASTDRHQCRHKLMEACRVAGSTGNSHLFVCCHGIVSLMVPIFSGNEIIGYIKCGNVFLSAPDLEEKKREFKRKGISPELYRRLLAEYSNIKLVPKSRLYAGAEATFAVANYITEMTSAALRQKELDNSRISLFQEQTAKANLEKALKAADFKLLASQINPHFLFNTLNTIAQMAYVEGAEKLAGLVWSLSDLLRLTLTKTEQLIPLKDELKMLESYLYIQSARFSDRLKIERHVEPGLDNVLIPGMLLQPLVENAIIHGLEPLPGAGRLGIKIWSEHNRIHAAIEDTGQGFNPVVITPKCMGLGLESVKNRLEYYYGENFTFSIDSRPGSGTRIFISFPRQEGAADEQD